VAIVATSVISPIRSNGMVDRTRRSNDTNGSAQPTNQGDDALFVTM
jgi:hypothetical protein